MAKIVVNENLKVNGKLTFEREINEQGTGFNISGVFATHLYFEDITSLDTPRFSLKGIEVYRESFGSDDYNILYHFTAESIEVFGTKIDDAYYVLYGEEIKMIEDEMYKNDHPILGDIGEEYKSMYKDDDSDIEKQQ